MRVQRRAFIQDAINVTIGVTAAATATLWVSGARSRPHLTLVHDPFPPYIGEDLPKGGLASNLCQTILAHAGYDSSIDLVPWQRALELTTLGRYDALVSAWYTDERNRDLAFSEPYTMNTVRLIQRRGSDIPYTGIEDVDNRVVGVVLGYHIAPALADRPDVILQTVNDLDTALRMLMADRIDFVFAEERVAAHTARGIYGGILGDLKFLRPVLSANGMRLAVSRVRPDHADIVAAFNASHASLRKEGIIRQIHTEHGFTLTG